uniref:probable thiopurine S-methyltransferase n=1 Tax=Oncorhynchus gorbuscha TaxID=8017 RepID=UPI001EAED724
YSCLYVFGWIVQKITKDINHLSHLLFTPLSSRRRVVQHCSFFCERKGVRFFFPLCGKAVDIKWLADMGHPVVGVDIAEMGIRQFFEDQKLICGEEVVPAIPGAKVYKCH